MRAGFVASRVEWRNRAASLAGDAAVEQLAAVTIAHFTAQIAAVEQAIRETIDGDDELRGRRDLLLGIDGVGETLAAIVLAELPAPEVIATGAQAVAYAGLNPRRCAVRLVDRPPDADFQNRQCDAAGSVVHAGDGGDAAQCGRWRHWRRG